MVRFLVLYRRPEDVRAFQEHYWNVHIPLTKNLPGLRRYTLSRNVRSIRGGDPYYLVAQLDWDDMEALEQAFRSPEGAATAEDVTTNLERLSPGVRSMIFELEDVVSERS
jgi:uncharacterized protein (TIGR02118 family)